MIFIVLLKDLIEDAEAKYGYAPSKYRMSGFYWVGKMKSNTKKGYIFRYEIQRKDLRTRFTRVDLLELRKEVDRRGLPWRISNELLARKLVSDEGLNWEDFKDERE